MIYHVDCPLTVWMDYMDCQYENCYTTTIHPDRSWQNEEGSLKVAQAEFVPGRDNSIHVHPLHLSQQPEMGSFK